jgi:hypothetical protein
MHTDRIGDAAASPGVSADAVFASVRERQREWTP